MFPSYSGYTATQLVPLVAKYFPRYVVSISFKEKEAMNLRVRKEIGGL